MNPFRRSTKFKAGGLVTDEVALAGIQRLAVPSNWTCPAYIDSRPYVLSASNQGQEPACAGFATAGWIEAHNWRTTSVAEQVDGHKIYGEAKTIDGSPKTDGTSLTAAVQAAKNLGLIAERPLHLLRTFEEIKFALHRHGCVIAGFNITDGWNRTSTKSGYIGYGSQRLGGHAVLLCYYDKVSLGFQNSWDITWGVQGFGRMTWKQVQDQFLYAVAI